MNDSLNKIIGDLRYDAQLAASEGVSPDLPAMLKAYADRIEKACDWQHQFTLELRYAEAQSCLDDALFVAAEREQYGVAQLVRGALDNLKTIGVLTGINGQKRIANGGAE